MNATTRLKLNNRQLGAHYEQVAKQYLESKGYHIIKMNYRMRIGEIDIIARDDTYTVFVEIKYRYNSRLGYPSENVHYRKQQTLLKVATAYLADHGLYDQPARFDVVEILGDQITHIKNAF